MPEIVPLFSAPVKHLSLSSTARVLARRSLWVEPEDSLALAASRMAENGNHILPVLVNDRVVGILNGEGLATALGEAIEPSDAVSAYVIEAVTIPGYATGAEALRSFIDGGPLVVVDDERRLIGLLSPSDLYPRYRPQLRPPLIGGVATPFGVYLTSGNLSAGVPKYALIASGAAITAMFSTALVLSHYAGYYLSRNGLTPQVTDGIQSAVAAVSFACIFRLVPLSGIHGAEHQTVHAIERELELTPSVVRRMPLVHPRCGTNYSVAVSIFLGVFGWAWTPDPLLRLIVAFAVTLPLWRTGGTLLQRFVTTKTPTDKQLNQAISAGHELLEKYGSVKNGYPNLPQRIWNTGLVFMLIGSSAIVALLALIGHVFNLNFLQ